MNVVNNYPNMNPDPSWATSTYANSPQQTATKKTQLQTPENQSSQKKNTSAVQERSLAIREDRVTLSTQSTTTEIVPVKKEVQELAVVRKTTSTYDAAARLAVTSYEEKSTPSPQQPQLIDIYA